MDASELYILEVPSTDIIECAQDDTQFVSKLVYGRYMPQVDMDFPRSEIKRHINDAVNKWLAFISGNTITYLGIEAIDTEAFIAFLFMQEGLDASQVPIPIQLSIDADRLQLTSP